MLSSRYTGIYAMLVAVVAGLVLSFIQVMRRPVHRTFVPRNHILWLKHYASDPATISLDRLVVRLTDSYHVMTLYLVSRNVFEPLDTVYKTLICTFDQTVHLSTADTQPYVETLNLRRGDVLTWPSHLILHGADATLCWSMHPVQQSIKQTQLDRQYIHSKWSKRRKTPLKVEDCVDGLALV